MRRPFAPLSPPLASRPDRRGYNLYRGMNLPNSSILILIADDSTYIGYIKINRQFRLVSCSYVNKRIITSLEGRMFSK